MDKFSIHKRSSGNLQRQIGIDSPARHLGHQARNAFDQDIYIDSVPYGEQGAARGGANVVIARKLPQLLDVKDLSAEDVRIAIEMKKTPTKMIMAYLFSTSLQ